MTHIADQQSSNPTTRLCTAPSLGLVHKWAWFQHTFLRRRSTYPSRVPVARLQTPIVRSSKRCQLHRQRGAFAIFTYGQGTEKRFLLRWNKNWGMFNLIGGKMDNARGDNNDFERTIRRELAEEVGLRSHGGSLLVNEIKQLFMRQYSYREKRVKDYHFAVFVVHAPDCRTSVQQRFLCDLPCMGGNVLATAVEIERLVTSDDQPISSTTRHILHTLGELPDFFTLADSKCILAAEQPFG